MHALRQRSSQAPFYRMTKKSFVKRRTGVLIFIIINDNQQIYSARINTLTGIAHIGRKHFLIYGAAAHLSTTSSLWVMLHDLLCLEVTNVETIQDSIWNTYTIAGWSSGMLPLGVTDDAQLMPIGANVQPPVPRSDAALRWLCVPVSAAPQFMLRVVRGSTKT